MSLYIDKFETDDELVNACLADHVEVGVNVFEDVLVLKERLAVVEAERNMLKDKILQISCIAETTNTKTDDTKKNKKSRKVKVRPLFY